MKSEKALNSFIHYAGEIQNRLKELTEYANDHMEYSPEEINWAHVGAESRILEKLTELTDMAFNRGEYAENGRGKRQWQ